jgi:hypothetical protein
VSSSEGREWIFYHINIFKQKFILKFMENPLWCAKRRAEILYISLELNRPKDKSMHRYGRLVDVMTSEKFTGYLISLGKAIAIIPSEKIDPEYRDVLSGIPSETFRNGERLTNDFFGDKEFKQGLINLTSSLP